MKKIIVTTDFSNGSENAINFAVSLAKVNISEIVLLHCFFPTYVDPAIPDISMTSIQMGQMDEFKDVLEQKALSVQELGVKTTSHLYFGDILDGINELIEKNDCDFVILGKTGKSNFIDRLLGTTAENIINSIKIPMAVIPEAIIDHKITNIVYATQLEFDELDILNEVFDLADKLKANVTLLKINTNLQIDMVRDKELLAEINKEFKSKKYDIVNIKSDDLEKAINEYSQTEPNSALVLASHNRGFLAQLINPSISKSIVKKTNVPTFVFHFKKE